MKSVRMALLAAAALAVVPGAAWAERQNQPDQNNHADRGDRGGDRGGRSGGGDARPAPPQGRGSGMMVMPGGAPGGFRPAPPAAPQPQAQPQNRGGWQGGWRGPAGQDRGNVRVDRPAPIPNADTGQARAQWRQGNPSDDRRWDNGRGQWNGGDRNRDNDNHRGDNDRGRWNNGDHNWNGDRGQWNNGDHSWNRDQRNNGDRRWDNNRGQWNNGDHSWNGRRDNDRRWDHRWDANRWRNDHRYDWRDWRGSHRDLFNRHYYAPRGYHYRSVYAGFFLEPLFYGSSYWLDNPYDYRLPPVEWPLQWIHYYNDALLVDVTTGEVVDVIPNFFF